MKTELSAFGDHDAMTGIRAERIRDDGRLLLADYRQSSTTLLRDILSRWLLALYANPPKPRQSMAHRGRMALCG